MHEDAQRCMKMQISRCVDSRICVRNPESEKFMRIFKLIKLKSRKNNSMNCHLLQWFQSLIPEYSNLEFSDFFNSGIMKRLAFRSIPKIQSSYAVMLPPMYKRRRCNRLNVIRPWGRQCWTRPPMLDEAANAGRSRQGWGLEVNKYGKGRQGWDGEVANAERGR